MNGSTVTLNVPTGAITQTGAGTLTATTLTGSARSVALTGDNTVTTLGAFTSTAGFASSDTGALSVVGAVTDATSVGLNASAWRCGTLSAPSVTLTATDGGINQTGGAVAAGTLTGSSVTTAALTSTGNAVGTLAGFTSSGGFTSTQHRPCGDPTVSDATSITLNAGGALSLASTLTTNALSLTATGAITQPGGAITAASLTGGAGSASLGQAGNTLGTLARSPPRRAGSR